MKIDTVLYDDFYGFIESNMPVEMGEGNRLLMLHDQVNDGSTIHDFLKDNFDIELNPETHKMYAYDLALTKEEIVYDGLTEVRSRLNHLYHLLGVAGFMGVELQINGSNFDFHEFVSLVEDETNLDIIAYQESGQIREGVVTIRVILKAA